MPGNVGSHVIVLGVPVPAKFSFHHKIKAKPPNSKNVSDEIHVYLRHITILWLAWVCRMM
jgi:hypothetical protein